MKKRFDFGLIDFSGHGASRNRVTVDVEYTDKGEGKKCFSASGMIWNSSRTDCLAGGQCLDTIAKYVNNPLFCEILRLWHLYHLNDMHPECEHQRAAGWVEQAAETVKIYKFKQTLAAIQASQGVERADLQAAKNGKLYYITDAECKLLNLEYSIKSSSETLPEDIAEHYKLDSVEEKTRGWLRPDEHPAGILCKPCPVCGYKYGTAWKYMPIPEYDEKIIISILDGSFKG